ncbi:GspH/FimT family pseudopilin [Lysobacter firmicutimachus]|uniref:Type II secretion system protein H n=1 Tax=Lysobacter firmicutimachus TaxID=1792846 RepID=A0AAU8MS36_9GAMM
MRRAAGFTLIELMVTIGIAAILLALALPSFTESIRSNRVSTATNQLLATINLARTEALRSKSSGRICPSTDGTGCAAGWGTGENVGLIVWTDENGNNALNPGEVKRYIEPQQGIRFSVSPAPPLEIRFDDRGRMTTTPAPAPSPVMSLQASVCKSGTYNRRTIDISRIGRTSVTKGVCS